MERSLRHHRLAIGLEGAEVVLEPCHQSHVLHRSGGFEGRQKVTDRRAVDADVLGFAVLPHPGGDRDEVRSHVRQGRRESLGVEQVGPDAGDPRQLDGAAARQAEGGPALPGEHPGEGLADDPRGSDDQSTLCLGHQSALRSGRDAR